MGMAPIAHVLWGKYMKYNPSNPKWWNRDRFVLSNGHACALQYVLLHLSGFKEYSMEQLQKFRQVGSKCPGHPENILVDGGIEVTTGPLGQGIGNAVGLAIAEAHLAASFNKPDFEIFNNFTYVFCGDGCLQEGVSCEASSVAGHLGLGKLILFYDDNHITIDGETDLSFSEDVLKRYESYGWHTQFVADGDNDIAAIAAALEAAQKVTDKPSIIKVRTTIGKGSSKQGTEKVHGSPLGAEEIVKVKKLFGFPEDKSFYVPDDVKQVYDQIIPKGQAAEDKWNDMYKSYSSKYPKEAAELARRMSNKLPENWRSCLPTFKPEDAAKATRQHSETVINAIAGTIPELIGGSADLNPSTLSYIKSSGDFQKGTHEGRNIRFGVREHGMASICNGIMGYGGLVSYGSTFLNFIGYAMGAVRLSALSHFGVIYVMTHDSIGLGEDGPTHQPIESLMAVRATPNILLLRPADGNETSGAYAVAIESHSRPSVLALSRQAIPNLKGSSIEGVFKGAYVLQDAEGGKPDVSIVGTGSEVSLAVEAAALLQKDHNLKVRVISMPSWELFREQSSEYQQSVFLEDVPVLAVEAASHVGWGEFSHASVAMHSFGHSGPAKDVFIKYGFTAKNVSEKALKLVDFYKGRKAGSLVVKPF